MDSYNLPVLKEELASLGFELLYRPQVSSTMALVSQFALKNKGKPCIALTDHQTHGKGRKSRNWYDTPGSSIMLSMLFFTKEHHIALFADLVALSVCLVLRDAFKDDAIQIKYPNDIVAHDKKLGGIIVENIYDKSSKYLGTNVGIGINMHYTQKELSAFSTDYEAISLDSLAGNSFKKQDILLLLVEKLRYLDTETDAIATNSSLLASFEEKWKEVASLLGRNVALLKKNRIYIKGRVQDVQLGEGMKLKTGTKNIDVSLFNSDMKVRIIS